VTADELELRALAAQAFDLRATPYFRDAIAAIVDWHDRRHLRAYERRQEELARLVRLLEETDLEHLTVSDPPVWRRAS
jgi:hypothetical protein